MAANRSVPLLERLRFLIIFSTNLDEFFEVRVAGLAEQLAVGVNPGRADGMSAQQTLATIRPHVKALVTEQYRLYGEILTELALHDVRLLNATAFGRRAAWIKRYFHDHLLPVLTPMGLDPAHPFPRVPNKSLYFIIALEGKDAFGRSNQLAVLQAPRSLPRVIALPHDARGGADFVLLSSILSHHVSDIFPGMKVLGCYPFRVTRNSHLWIDEEESQDLLNALAGELPRRHYGAAVRLEVAHTCPEPLISFLLQKFKLEQDDVYRVTGPVNINRLTTLIDQVDRPDLKYPAHVPYTQPVLSHENNLFEVLNKNDVLLHHPYDSFSSVVRMLKQASRDPKVVAVKMTLYRTGAGSPIVEALLACCKSGKDVTVVVELRARFDEAANIGLANRLQDAGANLVYGVVGYKTHAKMLLIVRRKGDDLQNFVHVGTGNYHPRTSTVYTDIGFLTSDPEMGNDVQRLFQQLTGLGSVQRLRKLWHAPFTLHKNLIAAIVREKKAARRGERAQIMIKINALSEPELIKHLYDASDAGVKIDLLVRGICCLKPGVPGLSENIRVRSVLGRFLEHSRVFYFYAEGEEKMFCSSADWMERNMFRRIEVCFPIENPAFKARIMNECLRPQWEAKTGVWELMADGTYKPVTEGTLARHPQEEADRLARLVIAPLRIAS